MRHSRSSLSLPPQTHSHEFPYPSRYLNPYLLSFSLTHSHYIKLALTTLLGARDTFPPHAHKVTVTTILPTVYRCKGSLEKANGQRLNLSPTSITSQLHPKWLHVKKMFRTQQETPENWSLLVCPAYFSRILQPRLFFSQMCKMHGLLFLGESMFWNKKKIDLGKVDILKNVTLA